MKSTRSLFILLALCSGFWPLSVEAAPRQREDEAVAFLHSMQTHGFADVAIDYLNALKKQPNAPKEIMELWELEMSRSKQEAAKHAYSAAQAKQYTDEAKQHLDNFVKENPDHPKAVQALATWSEQKAIEAQYLILLSDYMTDKAAIAENLSKARKLLEEVRPRFVNALQVSVEEFKKMPTPGPRALPRSIATRIDEASTTVGFNRLTIAMVDFYIAQTMKDKPAERTELLTKIAKNCDDIYQEYRTSESDVRTRAHFWTGRILQLQEKFKDAKDVYDEVLASDPALEDPAQAAAGPVRGQKRIATGQEPFFADVEQFYLQVVKKTTPEEYPREAAEWRKTHKEFSEKCSGYQAISLELAKYFIALSEKGNKNAAKEAAKILAEMAKIPSPYQGDAMTLRRQMNGGNSAEGGFEDEVFAGQEAVDAKKWAEAIEHLEKALEKGKTAKPERLQQVYNTIVACKHHIALALYGKKELDDAIKVIREAMLKPEYRNTASAPQAALFMLTTQYYQFSAANGKAKEDADKAAAEELAKKTLSMADAVAKAWPKLKDVGDAARIIKMRVYLDKDDLKSAGDVIKEIDPQSPDFARAQFVIGYANWHKYREGKKRLDPAAPDAKLEAACAENRKLAVEYIEKSVAAYSAGGDNGGSMPQAMFDATLQLGDISAEGGDFKKAVSHYQPLLDDLAKRSSTPPKESDMRMMGAALRAYMQINDMANACKVGEKVLDLGADDESGNISMMNFARRLDAERKTLEAALATAEDPAAREKMKGYATLLEKIMTTLSKREKISPAGTVWIAKTCSLIGTDAMDTLASEQVKKIFDRADTDQDFEKAIKKARPQLQTLAVDIQVRKGDYAAAAKLADDLVKEHPKALEPRISLATIRQKEAEKNPEKYQDAIAAWETLRAKLERVPARPDDPSKPNGPKSRMKEYYDATYNEAFCFYMSAKKNNQKEDAKKGLQLLLPLLKFDPKIQGPAARRDPALSSRFFALGDRLAEYLGMEKPSKQTSSKAPADPKPAAVQSPSS